jgi:hypothetical protein
MPPNKSNRDTLRSTLRNPFSRRSSRASSVASSTGTDDGLPANTVAREGQQRPQTRSQSRALSTQPVTAGMGSISVSNTRVASPHIGGGGSGSTSAPIIPAIFVQAAGGMSPGSSSNIPAQNPVGLALPTGSYSRSLWEEAFATLSADDQSLLSSHQDDFNTVLQLVLRDTRAQKIIYERNHWSLTWRGKEFRMGDITDRIISWIERFVEVGDTIVQHDPGHAALP